MAYDFKRLVYGSLMFTASMYIMLLIVAGLGANYDKDLTQIGGDLFDHENWILWTTNAYDDAASLRNASATASVTNLDEPTSSKSIFDKIVDFTLLPFNLLFTVMGVIFEVPAPIMWTLATMLVIELILVVWRLLRAGD